MVMRCLEKDRSRWYESAAALARDIERFLADEVVEARPPTAGYRLRKFVRRHRGPVLAAAAVAVLLVAGIVGTTAGMLRAVDAERDAEGRRREAVAAAETAGRRLAQLEEGYATLGSVFRDLDPRAEQKEGRPLRALLGDRLDETARRLDEGQIGDPVAVARVRQTLGVSLVGLGYPGKAVGLLAEARAALAAHLGPDHQDTLACTAHLGAAYRMTGRAAEAVALLERVRDARAEALGPDHPDTLAAVQDLAKALTTAGRGAAALALFERVRDERARVLGPDHLQTLEGLYEMANACRTVGRMGQATALLEGLREPLARRLGPDHSHTLNALENLGVQYLAAGRTAEAIAVLEPLRAAQADRFGPDHRNTLHTVHHLGVAYADAGDVEQGLGMLERAAAGFDRLGLATEEWGLVVPQLYEHLERAGRYAAAEAWRRKWLAEVRRRDGPGSLAAGEALAQLGANLVRQGRDADVEPVLREGLAILLKELPAGPVVFDGITPEFTRRWLAGLTTAVARAHLGGVLVGRGEYGEAEPLLVQGYDGLKQWERDPLYQHGGGSAAGEVAECLDRLAELAAARGRPAEAARWRAERAKYPPSEAPPPRPAR
ncbi:MAG: tetratricopeptide repeat-containing protein [Gemmataceae bacterium]|nr:tetratricopeptide repeat-containing protein [Gemmataceae bacterium]